MKHTFIATLLAATIALPAYAADYTIIAPAAPAVSYTHLTLPTKKPG
ncbi:hypothetical protein [Rhizobium leguminosarum]|nr:hypothetical protein [Rhizobium leguminosarum]